MPQTDCWVIVFVLRLVVERLRTVFPVIVFTPCVVAIPRMYAMGAPMELLLRLATVLPVMLALPVLKLTMPVTTCPTLEGVEVAALPDGPGQELPNDAVFILDEEAIGE